MAFTGITATEAEIDQKSGANVSTDFTDTMKTQSLLQAESWLNLATEYNWSDWYATAPNVDFKYLVTLVTSSIVAKDAINYDMSGFTSRSEAQTMLDVLDDNIRAGIKLLEDDKTKTFLGVT